MNLFIQTLLKKILIVFENLIFFYKKQNLR